MIALADIIAAEADLVSAFVLLLKEEQELLQQGRADALAGVIERKTAIVARLSPVTVQRNAALASAGLPPDRAGVDAWQKKHPTDANTRKQWERLQQLAQEAKELNRLNGELIRMRMQSNSEALESLIAAANRQELYSADGQTASSAGRRIIDSA